MQTRVRNIYQNTVLLRPHNWHSVTIHVYDDVTQNGIITRSAQERKLSLYTHTYYVFVCVYPYVHNFILVTRTLFFLET